MIAVLPEGVLLSLGFLVGLVIGSFLAATLIRWPQNRSVRRGRSHCDSCGTALGIRDLVPILSWLLNRGRCRHCGAVIDRRHLAMEAGAALLGLTAIAAHPFPEAIATALLGWWLFLIAALDLEHQWLPDRLTLPLIPAGLVVASLGIGPDLADRVIGAAAGFLVLSALALLYRKLRGREGLGGGDPKLLAALGAWLGWEQLPFVMLGAGLLGLAAVLLMRLRGQQVKASDRLPLGTLLALAAWPIWLVVAR
jgi:leader peptidase (prepilin peptidase)/N-methyltransferase